MSIGRALKASVGAKAVMAVTGLLLLLFVIAHMLGNLQLFRGPEALNGYARTLKGLGPLLWVARVGLAAVFVAHVATAARLTRLNRAARPIGYTLATPQVTSYAARTMVLSGLIVLGFVAYHLLHFTLGVTHPRHFALRDAAGHPDVYAMVVLGFRQAPVALLYVLAQGVLALHVSHGASSLFQSLGVTHPALARVRRLAGPALALLIFVGNVSMPLACLLGWVPPPGRR